MRFDCCECGYNEVFLDEEEALDFGWNKFWDGEEYAYFCPDCSDDDDYLDDEEDDF